MTGKENISVTIDGRTLTEGLGEAMSNVAKSVMTDLSLNQNVRMATAAALRDAGLGKLVASALGTMLKKDGKKLVEAEVEVMLDSVRKTMRIAFVESLVAMRVAACSAWDEECPTHDEVRAEILEEMGVDE